MGFGGIFTIVLCVIGTGYGWMNPFVGLMIYYLFSILRPEFLWFWAFPDSAPRFSLLVAISTLLGWFMTGFGDFTKLKGVFFPMAGLLLYALCGFLTTETVAVNKDVAWDALDIQIKIILMATITFSLVRTPGQIKAFAWVLTGGLAYLGWVFFSQSYFQHWNRLEWRGFGGIDNNGAAMIMVTGLPLTFYVALSNKRWWVKGLCFIGAACLIDTVFLSNSRGGMLGLCMVGGALFLVALFFLPKKGLTIALAIAFALIAYRFAGEGVIHRFMSIFNKPDELDASAASRYETWGAAWRCIQDNPWGVGPRNFNLIAFRYGLPSGKSVHNLFLQTGADYGVLGAVGLAVFYVGTALNCFLAARLPAAARLVWPRYFCHAVTISISGFVVCSMFIGMESVETAYLVAILGLCTVAYVHRVSESELPAAESGLLELEQVPVKREDSDGVAVM